MPTSDTDQKGIRTWNVHRIEGGEHRVFTDNIVVEEPLEIRVIYGPADRRDEMPLSITMRTPGDDIDLVTGFLITEGIAVSIKDIHSTEQRSDNVVIVSLHPDVGFQPDDVQRHFYTTSSCGVCGKSSIDMVRQVSPFRLNPKVPRVPFTTLMDMGDILSGSQPVFASTGGIHATALFTAEGDLLCTKEDIGRHNAMDKLVGWAATHDMLPLSKHVVVVSGRGGFELVQKAMVAGVAIFAAVGAPSSLAIELAAECDMTLVGFLRADRMNVYTCPERVGSRIVGNR